jgi:predicted acylesterase/phospholipase RssA
VPPVYPEAQSPLDVALRTLGRMAPGVSGNGAGLPNSFDVIARTLQIMQHELGNVRAGEADLLINPDLGDYWVLEFWRAAEMIEQGRRAAEAKLPEIRKKIDALRGRDT